MLIQSGKEVKVTYFIWCVDHSLLDLPEIENLRLIYDSSSYL